MIGLMPLNDILVTSLRLTPYADDASWSLNIMLYASLLLLLGTGSQTTGYPIPWRQHFHCLHCDADSAAQRAQQRLEQDHHRSHSACLTPRSQDDK